MIAGIAIVAAFVAGAILGYRRGHTDGAIDVWRIVAGLRPDVVRIHDQGDADPLPAPDWSRGIRDRDACTPDSLRASACGAIDRAKEWIACAEQLLAKAEDLES